LSSFRTKENVNDVKSFSRFDEEFNHFDRKERRKHESPFKIQNCIADIKMHKLSLKSFCLKNDAHANRKNTLMN
jgi:hypothetical protein